MTGPRAPLLAAVLVAMLLPTGCATMRDVLQRDEPSVSSAAPTHASAGSEQTRRPPPMPAVTVLPADAHDASLERHARMLAGRLTGLPAAVDAGYYMDVLQARLQQAANTGFELSRDATRIRLTIDGGHGFASGQTEPSAALRERITAIAALLADYDALLIAVHGHSDNAGPVAANRRISELRAVAVAELLRAGGIDRERLVVSGFGADRPRADNASEDGRARNRRIELLLQLLVRES